MLFIMPFSSPLPAPNKIVSIRMPQKTPKAVKMLRTLLRAMVCQISCHLSRSNIIGVFLLFGAHGLNRFDSNSLSGRYVSGNQAGKDQYDGGDYNNVNVDCRIHENGDASFPISSSFLTAVNRKIDQFKNADSEHHAQVSEKGCDNDRFQQDGV